MAEKHPYLTDEEVQFIRREINKRRMPGSYEAGKWSVSHYNRRSNITEGKYPKSVVLRDITLRTAEQTPVVSLDSDERLRLAEALIEAGVRSLQVNWTVGAGWASADLIKRIKELAPGIELTVDGITSKEQIETAANVGIDVPQFMNPSIPAITPIYYPEVLAMAWRGEDWRKKYRIRTIEEQIGWATELIYHAKKHKIKASSGINMLSYSTDEYLQQYCAAIAKAGTDYICLYDGSSGMGPEAWEHVVSVIKRVAPQPKIVVHPHNAFGLGVANALGAVKGGAHIVEVSVNHLCSATGQADFAEVAAALEVLYGVDTGIRLEKLTSLSKIVEDITRVKMAQNKPITGERAWAYTAGLTDNELDVEPLLHFCVEPSIFGNKKVIFYGKNMPPMSALRKLELLGIEMQRELIPQLVERNRSEISIRKRALTDEEFREIAETVKASSRK